MVKQRVSYVQLSKIDDPMCAEMERCWSAAPGFEDAQRPTASKAHGDYRAAEPSRTSV